MELWQVIFKMKKQGNRNPEIAKLWQVIFKMKKQGKSNQEIADHLNKEGITTNWEGSHIEQLLQERAAREKEMKRRARNWGW